LALTLEALQIIDAIDRKGSFAGAAAELERVPSALTYSVRKLEEDLDVLLFDRSGHRAKLTPAGQELLIEGRHLLRAADELEQRVKRTASGWEVELRIVLDNVIPFEKMIPVIQAFDRQGSGTRLRFSVEVLSGVWEAVLSGKADLAIGAVYTGPETIRMTGGFRTMQMMSNPWVFAVAPSHPLAKMPEPLTVEQVKRHRAIAVGDTGRSLPTFSTGLLTGQETLTVPSLSAKLQAQLAGLGCGHLPLGLAAPHLATGALIEKQTMDMRPPLTKQIVWRTSGRGKCLKWFLNYLSDPNIQASLADG
jgi:DNA-binding transcriptional LysR family regulator